VRWCPASKPRRAALTPGYVVKTGFGFGTSNFVYNLFGFPSSGCRQFFRYIAGPMWGPGGRVSGAGSVVCVVCYLLKSQDNGLDVSVFKLTS
jgi:hypothetical protein